jgi:outer membrane protein assembly factor BamD
VVKYRVIYIAALYCIGMPDKVLMKALKNILICLSLLSLAACSSDNTKPEDMTEQQLYQEAQANLDHNNYLSAVKNLQLLEARYPFGPYAEQAQLEIIYAHYRNFESSASIAAADRFIRLHPQHPNVDYAYYMKGLVNYSEDEGFLSRYMPTDITKRDPGAALQSYEDFRQLLYA